MTEERPMIQLPSPPVTPDSEEERVRRLLTARSKLHAARHLLRTDPTDIAPPPSALRRN